MACVLVSANRVHGSEVVDLKDGARTTFYGKDVWDNFGWATAFGDVDGDGYTDFIGSTRRSRGPDDATTLGDNAYLFFGRPRSKVDSLYHAVPGTADVVFYRGGYAMTCADLNSDGYDDMIFTDGRCFVMFGGPREQFRSVYMFDENRSDYTPPDVLIKGGNYRFGGTVFNVPNASFDEVARALDSGDFNGDGFADIAVGHPMNPGGHGWGVAYLIFGRPRAAFPPVINVDPDSDLPHPDVEIWGDLNEQYPFSLAVGDLDGDGMDDLITTTLKGWGEENILPQSGEVHCFWGRKEWKHVYDTQIDEFDFALWGSPINRFGYRVAMGDLDGDGRDDLIVGSPQPFTGGRGGAGSYRVFFGRPRGTWPKWSSGVDLTDVFILGADGGDALNGNLMAQTWGIAFSFATGDRNGDLFEDLLIGAGNAAGPASPLGGEWRAGAGEAYLIGGRPSSMWPPFIDLRDGYDMIVYGAQGTPEYPGAGRWWYDLLGWVVGMADFDGNGLDDLFLSAQFADGPGDSLGEAGEVYIVFDAGTAASPPTPVASAERSSLLSNYPNPFNPATTLRFRAPVGERVSLTIYDALGREVAHPLVSAQVDSDLMEVPWEANDERGMPLASGVYFVKLVVGREVHSRKVLLVR